MKLLRRQFLHLAAGVAAFPALSRIASAQTYPSRPVRLIVPYPPRGGQGGEILGRQSLKVCSGVMNGREHHIDPETASPH
jgi:hypothetical protein